MPLWPETRWWLVLEICASKSPPDLGPRHIARAVIDGCYRLQARAIHAHTEAALARLEAARDQGLALLEETD